jgi:type IV secretion system protein VirD4
MPVLRDYFTLLRGYGVQIFAFYQDISQLRQTFPNDWETILNNAGVLGVFGLSNYKMACDWSQLLGMHADDLFRMKSEEMVLCTPGRRSEIVRRLNYLTDDLFRGMFSPNPRFSK